MKKLMALCFLMCLYIAGCSAPGGSEGDANDPAVDGSDAEQFSGDEEEDPGE